jgi:hypothetical protein
MKTDIEFANQNRTITKEWIEQRIKEQDIQKLKGIMPNPIIVELTEELKKHYAFYDKIITDLKSK